MAKKKDEQPDEQATEQVAAAEAEQEQAEQGGAEPQTEPGEGQNPLNQETAAQETRVANNGDVSDPGNSGLVGDAFTEGSVTGNADKPNG
jgi:hypothetical protein